MAQSTSALLAASDSADECDVSCDGILDGRIRLYQPRRGHRAGTDAVLLAAAVPAGLSGPVLDVGAGVGTVGLIVAQRCPMVSLGLIENDPSSAALARRNLALNEVVSRSTVYEANIFSKESCRAAGLKPGLAELILTNPPFAEPDRVRASPHAGKRGAHVMQDVMQQEVMQEGRSDTLAIWVRACLALLSPGGTFVMIHKPEALADILAACGQRLGAITILPVYPNANKAAHRILLRGKKGSRAPLSIAPPLILQDMGHFTPMAEALHRGEALIEW